MQIRTSVEVKNAAHPRTGQAGQTWSVPAPTDTDILVKFDLDDAEVMIAIADLKAL